MTGPYSRWIMILCSRVSKNEKMSRVFVTIKNRYTISTCRESNWSLVFTNQIGLVKEEAVMPVKVMPVENVLIGHRNERILMLH